jgi:hypothetical protein
MTQLNTVAVTSLLSSQAPAPAIYWETAPQRANSGDDAFFPYITVSAPANTLYATKDSTGDNAILQVDIWARTKDGALERLARAAHEALHRTAWNVPGFITAEVEGMDFMGDPDGKTRRCMIRVRVLALPHDGSGFGPGPGAGPGPGGGGGGGGG